jgi:radical SAM protein with 4Fe4S-binding SPASM domain
MPTPSASKQWLKKHLPSPILRPLRTVRSVLRGYHYWLPYNVFADGRAWPPTTVTLDVTYICNLKCEMCPQALDFEKKDSNLLRQYRARQEMTTDQILGLVDEAAEIGVRTFNFTGGEIFLRQDILTLAERVKLRGMACRLNTNGMLLTPPIARRIVELGVDTLTISVDGPGHIHNLIRKHGRSFQRLLEGVRLIQAEQRRQARPQPLVLFSNTISASNVAHMSELMDVAGEYGVDVGFGYLYYVTEAMEARTTAILKIEPVKGEDHNMPAHLKRIDAAVVEEQVRAVRRKEKQYGVNAFFAPDLKPREIQRRYEDDSHAPSTKCYYAWNQARITPYGDVYPCGPISINMGNVTQQPLATIWNNQQFRDFRKMLRRNRLFPKCTKCCALNETAWRYLPALRR